MKFITSRSKFLNELNKVKPICASKGIIPILEYILVQTIGSKVVLTATDLENTLSVDAVAEIKTEGAIAVPGNLLANAIAALPETPFVFEADLETNTIQIITDSGNYKLCGASADDFPEIIELSDCTSFTLDSAILEDSISIVLPFAGADDLRPQMFGVCLDIADKVSFVATDGNALALVENDIQLNTTGQYIIPSKAANTLKATLPNGEIEIFVNNTNIQFSANGYRLTARLVDARYPAYRNVFPIEEPKTAVVDRNNLSNAIKRTGLFANSTTNQGRFKFNGNLTLTAADVDFSNEAKEVLDCDFNSEEMEIGLNLKIIQKALTVLESQDVKIALFEPSRPILISKSEESDVRILVMPIVLNY